MTVGLYRPFCKNYLYFNRDFINDVAYMPRIFLDLTSDNRMICVIGLGTTKEFSVIITDKLPDLQIQANSQCFPLKLYERKSVFGESIKSDDVHNDLFGSTQPSEESCAVKNGITDRGLAHFQLTYPT